MGEPELKLDTLNPKALVLTHYTNFLSEFYVIVLKHKNLSSKVPFIPLFFFLLTVNKGIHPLLFGALTLNINYILHRAQSDEFWHKTQPLFPLSLVGIPKCNMKGRLRETSWDFS